MPHAAAPRRALLADGREILYFDDAETRRAEPAADSRSLPPREGSTELRWDPLLEEPVIIATQRQDRTFLPSAGECPICPSRPGAASEIPDADYDVVAFENRFPSLPAAVLGEPDGAPGGPPGQPATAAGRCEVISFSSQHDASFAMLPELRLQTLAGALAHRTAALLAEPGVAHVFSFENRGVEIGVTLHHPHGQIYAYPFIPPRVGRMLSAARHHQLAQGSCIGCDLLADELAEGTRIVGQNDAGVAYVPRSASWPFEVHVVPRRHVADLASLSPAERHALLLLQADVLTRLDAIFGEPVPYMAGWIGSPNGDDHDLLHLRLQIVSPRRAPGKLKYLASSESLMGAFINDVRPEEAAERLRRARGRIG